MSEWRTVHIQFRANNEISRGELASFIERFVIDNPGCIDPQSDAFCIFGWIRKWDERTLSIHEDEMCTAHIGFEEKVLPFFEQLNGAISGVSYEGELVRFDNGGEYCKQTRKVSFDGSVFTTSVDYWFEDDENPEPPCSPMPKEDAAQTPPLQEGKVVVSGRATKCGNAFSWFIDESGMLTIFAEGEGDVINGFGNEDCPWSRFTDDIVKARFLTGLRAKSLDCLFHSCYSLEEVEGFGLLDSSQLTSMKALFVDCEGLKNVDFTGLDTSRVTDMSELLSGCVSLESVDLSQLDTTNVTNMADMFALCESLESLDLTPLDTSNVTDLSGFLSGLSVESIDLSPLDTSRVTSMRTMFADCSNLRSIDLSSLDVGSVTDMSQMFEGCTSLQHIDLSSMDTSSVTNMSIMFYGCVSLKSVDLSALDITGVKEMSMMFGGCEALESVDLSTDVPLTEVKVHNMFQGCESLMQVNLTGWDKVDMSFSFLRSALCAGRTL